MKTFYIIVIWSLPILAIIIPAIIGYIQFKREVNELNKEFAKEVKRIDYLESRLINKNKQK
jgi:cytochrome c-type biogenesis protein CcmH/NrfF